MMHSDPTVMAEHPEPLPGNSAGRRELLLIGLFSLLAAVRVFLFTAAFPFFNNVDEHYHLALVCRYSHADVPRGLDPCSAEAAALIALYGSPEYFGSPRDFPSGKFPPPVWARPAEARAEAFQQRKERWMAR